MAFQVLGSRGQLGMVIVALVPTPPPPAPPAPTPGPGDHVAVRLGHTYFEGRCAVGRGPQPSLSTTSLCFLPMSHSSVLPPPHSFLPAQDFSPHWLVLLPGLSSRLLHLAPRQPQAAAQMSPPQRPP